MDIRIAKKNGLAIKHIGACSNGTDIFITYFDEELAKNMCFDSFEEALLDMLTHESLHIILHKIKEDKASDDYDNIYWDVDSV